MELFDGNILETSKYTLVCTELNVTNIDCTQLNGFQVLLLFAHS